MNENFIREIEYYEDHFWNFYQTLKPEIQKKVDWTLELVATLDRIPKKYFQHMENTSGIYEVRIKYGSDIFRIFSFFDKGNLVVLINGFQKKSQKTPKKELDLAEKLKQKYLKEKYGK